MTLNMRAPLRSLTVAAALIGLVACAGQQLSADGMKLIQNGQTEQGLAMLARASELEPTNSQLRVDYLKYQLMAVREWLRRGDEARAAGQPAVAREMYLATLRIDPSNYRARRGLEALEADERHRALVVEANKLMNSGDLAGARAKLRQVLLENPQQPEAQRLLAQVNERIERAEETARLKSAATSVLKKPVTLQFRDANVRMVFEALSRTTGLNVIFDRDVRADLKTTIFVTNASVGDTVDLILLQNQLEKKVLNANTMLIYPATAAKQKEFQDLKVRTFQISNGDAKHLQSVLKTVLKIKDIALDERTNTLVIRDTADAVAVAEKVVAAHDFPDAEVMLEVEVLEVARDRLLNLGIKWPDNVTIATPPAANTIGAMADLTTRDLLITPLSVGFNFKLEDTDANLLASPRIRTRNKEKARIMIGDKVPVITNTTTPLATGASVVTGSVQYLDVGIKLEVEPQIYAEGDVGIKLFLDVSNIVKEIPGPQGSLAYQIGTRSAQTNLRLRDGETAIIGGLISELDRKTAAKVPGLGQLPVLGRLFSNNNSNTLKSEIILSITPRLVRSVATADASLRDIYSGTESSMRQTPLRLDPVGAASGAPAVVSGAVPGGPSTAPVTPSRLPPRTAPSTTRPADAAPAAQPAPASGATADTTPAATPGGEQAQPASGAPSPPRAPDAAIEPAPSNVPAPITSAPLPSAPTASSAATSAPATSTSTTSAPNPPVGSGGTPDVTINGPNRVRVGEEFEVMIDATIPAPLQSLPLVIRFDPKVLTLIEARPADLARNSGIDGMAQKLEPTTGRLDVDLQAAGKPLSGQGKLLNLRFAAKTARAQTTVAVGQANPQSNVDGPATPKATSLRLRVGP
jgi:general secretion pathway protein D